MLVQTTVTYTDHNGRERTTRLQAPTALTIEQAEKQIREEINPHAIVTRVESAVLK